MGEIGCRLSFTAESFYEGLVGRVLGMKDLYGDLAVEQRVLTLIDIGHSAPGNVGRDVIALGQFGGGFHRVREL